MKFKIGDRVRVIYNSNGSGIVKGAMNKTGIVKSMHDPKKCGMIYVEFGDAVYWGCAVMGFFKNEIEKINTKGQQLLFPFMK